jgi:NADH-quinone oxidoreductase subunit I
MAARATPLLVAGVLAHDAQPEDGLAPSGDPVEGVDTVTTRQVGRDTTEGVRR